MTTNREKAIHDAIVNNLPDGMGYVLVITAMGHPDDKYFNASVLSNGRMTDVPRCLRSAADSVERTVS